MSGAAQAASATSPLRARDLLAALVVKASPKEVVAYRRGQQITISGKGLAFVAPMLAEKAPQSRRIRPGAVVRLRNSGNDAWEIAQLPEVQAALVSIDSRTGAVRALVGGFDFNRNKFNHVTQALRQPGSSFKPFIYSAALEREFGPGNVLADEPLYYPAGVTGSKAWEPKNYDGRYAGPMTLRESLARSKNMVAIRLLEQITPEYARDYLTRFGFDGARNPAYLTLALGAGAATPWEMAAGYAVFANGGYRIQPYIVRDIRDANGRSASQRFWRSCSCRASSTMVVAAPVRRLWSILSLSVCFASNTTARPPVSVPLKSGCPALV